MIHEVKCWPGWFGLVVSGIKPFEVRRFDRDYAAEDTLVLKEWIPGQQRYTGREITRRITYVMMGGQFGIAPDYCVLGIAEP